MANSLNSYAKTLIGEHRAITALIHEHGGYEANRLTDSEITTALKHPHAKLVHEMLHALSGYIRSFKEQVDARNNLKDQLTYLADAMPVIELQHEQIFGEERVMLGKILEEMQQQFNDLMSLNAELNINIEILQTALLDLETYATVIDRNWNEFRHEMLDEILQNLERQNIHLSDKDKQDFLKESGWGELIKQVRSEKIPLPKHIDFSKPDYIAYFELKRCIAFAHSQKSKGEELVAVNDSIHKDIQDMINEFGGRTDNVIAVALGQFEEIFNITKSEADKILEEGEAKKLALLEINQRAMEAALLAIPDAESLMSIAKRTIAKGIELRQQPKEQPERGE